jgi:cobyrinic acid a,c-diamide synthase
MNLGYRDATLIASCALGDAGQKFKGHEFHYSTLLTRGDDEAFAEVSDAYGAAPTPSGSRRGSVTGSYFHIIAEAR